jgi:uncharacterized protein with PIN domain
LRIGTREEIANDAVAAFERYGGKGRKHRASLNFGDCACAKAHGVSVRF